jgi:predicted Zn-dependent peptidase
MVEINTGRMNEAAYFTKLPNGLGVFHVRKPGFTKKTAVLGVNYGSVDAAYKLDGRHYDTPLGVAHFLEHKLFDLPDGRNTLQLLSQMGVSPNAFTSAVATAYYFTCNDNFMPAFELLMEFVYTPHFTPESVEKEQGIIAQEIFMRNDMPDLRLFNEIFTSLYSTHPIRCPIIGTHESIKAITADTLYSCYNAFYRPSNMVLTVVGDFDPDEIESIAHRLSPDESLPAPDTCLSESPDEPQAVVEHEKTIRMDVPKPMFIIGIKLVPQDCHLSREINCRLALAVLAGPQSRLYGELYDSGLIDSGFGAIPYLFKKGGVLLLKGRSCNPLAVRDALEKEIDSINKTSIDAQLFERVKRAAWGDCMRISDSPEALSRSIALDYMSGADYFSLPKVFDDTNITSVHSLFSDMRNISIVICDTIQEV